MPRIGAQLHTARPWRVLGAPQLTIVAKLAPDFPLGQRFAAVTASTLRRVSKAITDPARQPWLKVVERADALATERALQQFRQSIQLAI